jgi:hypothetical protein
METYSRTLDITSDFTLGTKFRCEVSVPETLSKPEVSQCYPKFNYKTSLLNQRGSVYVFADLHEDVAGDVNPLLSSGVEAVEDQGQVGLG